MVTGRLHFHAPLPTAIDSRSIHRRSQFSPGWLPDLIEKLSSFPKRICCLLIRFLSVLLHANCKQQSVAQRSEVRGENMHCPQCQHQNNESAKFCEECGARLITACPQCGQAVSPTAKFCAECGTSLMGRVSSSKPVLSLVEGFQVPSSQQPPPPQTPNPELRTSQSPFPTRPNTWPRKFCNRSPPSKASASR